MSESPISGGALDAILAEHKARKVALEQEAAALRELAQTVVPPVPAGVVVPATPTIGPQTSEGQRSKMQQIIGGVLAIAGSIVAMLTASKPENPILPIISAIIAAIGGAMGNQASSSYAQTRATIKTGGAQ